MVENMDPYVRIRTRFYQKYDVQSWCEMPGDDSTYEEMFSSFKQNCAEPVLRDLGNPITSVIVLSSILNKVDDEFYNLLNMYMVFLTRAPLNLTQLCRVVLSIQGTLEVIRLFKKVTSPKVRELLSHMIQDPV